MIIHSQLAYFAVPDPDDPAVMTYWRRNARGELAPHPLRAAYGPMLYRRGDHDHVVPHTLRGQARRNWVAYWCRTVRHHWLARVESAIADDESAAARRFATFCTRCCICGRTLTEESSRAYGIGPECRAGPSDEVLARLADAVSRAHAEQGAGA